MLIFIHTLTVSYIMCFSYKNYTGRAISVNISWICTIFKSNFAKKLRKSLLARVYSIKKIPLKIYGMSQHACTLEELTN